MHRWSILIIVQRDVVQSSLFIILQVHCTCFGCQLHPSSGVHKTVTTASGTVQLPPSNVAKLAWPRSKEVAAQKIWPWPRWMEVAAQKIWPVPEAVVTVFCTPDDGCGWHPKHVEWTCRIINRLFCVASHWTVINININWGIFVRICNIFSARSKLAWPVLLTQYCAGDKIEKNEMGWACGAYGWGDGGV